MHDVSDVASDASRAFAHRCAVESAAKSCEVISGRKDVPAGILCLTPSQWFFSADNRPSASSRRPRSSAFIGDGLGTAAGATGLGFEERGWLKVGRRVSCEDTFAFATILTSACTVVSFKLAIIATGDE